MECLDKTTEECLESEHSMEKTNDLPVSGHIYGVNTVKLMKMIAEGKMSDRGWADDY